MSDSVKAVTGINYPAASGHGEVRVEEGASLVDAPEHIVAHCVEQGYARRDSIELVTPEAEAYHAEGAAVFHTNPECKVGSKIAVDDRRVGKGGKRPCRECLRG